MQISKSFRIRPKDVIAMVGGGGKTTAMFRLADELAAINQRVITTATTRVFAAQIKLAPHNLVYDPSPGFLLRVQSELGIHPSILIVGEKNSDGKALGVPREFVDELITMEEVDNVIYEADGARMRPFKAPASHEPVVASSTTLLVPVMGIHAIGAVLNDQQVHRPESIARIAKVELGAPITPEIVARVVMASEGGLKNKPPGARVIALLNQVESGEQLDSAREIAERLLQSSAIEAVAIGAVQNERIPIQETHRRVAAIITAAGAGARMQGRIKQLLPWRGKTLIENAMGIADASEANQILVVLGANAQEIRAHLAQSEHAGIGTRTRIEVNPGWHEGHAASIRTALASLSPDIDAAIFINADQPLLTGDIINQIIQRYRTSGASIIVPFFAGKRGSPVLFQRTHFEELGELRGEAGGRELIAKYNDLVERVDFEEGHLGIDVDTMDEYNSALALSQVVRQG